MPAGISGTVTERADLGLPAIPDVGGDGSADWTQLLTGSHTLRVWSAGPAMSRVALLGSLGESDIVRNGADVWTWSSADNAATHLRLPSIGATTPGSPARDPAGAPGQPRSAAVETPAGDAATGSGRDPGRAEPDDLGPQCGRGHGRRSVGVRAGDRAARHGFSGREHSVDVDATEHVPLRLRRVREGTRIARLRDRVHSRQLRPAGRVGLRLLAARRGHGHAGPRPPSLKRPLTTPRPRYGAVGAARLGDRFGLDGHPRRTSKGRAAERSRRCQAPGRGSPTARRARCSARSFRSCRRSAEAGAPAALLSTRLLSRTHHRTTVVFRRRRRSERTLRGRRVAQVTLAVASSGLTKRFGRVRSPSTASTSPFRPAACTGSSARTAPGRPRRSGCSSA